MTHVECKTMTLQALLKEYGIRSQRELRQKTGMTKEYAWRLWRGRINIGWKLATRLSQQLTIPFERFQAVERPVKPKGRPVGRPRKNLNGEEPRDV